MWPGCTPVATAKLCVQEIAMQHHLSNLQFFVASIALVLFAILALASILRIGRRKRTPPFLNYFNSRFDLDESDENSPRRPSYIQRDEW